MDPLGLGVRTVGHGILLSSKKLFGFGGLGSVVMI
jgi:hypothetical protein